MYLLKMRGFQEIFLQDVAQAPQQNSVHKSWR